MKDEHGRRVYPSKDLKRIYYEDGRQLTQEEVERLAAYRRRCVAANNCL